MATGGRKKREIGLESDSVFDNDMMQTAHSMTVSNLHSMSSKSSKSIESARPSSNDVMNSAVMRFGRGSLSAKTVRYSLIEKDCSSVGEIFPSFENNIIMVACAPSILRKRKTKTGYAKHETHLDLISELNDGRLSMDQKKAPPLKLGMHMAPREANFKPVKHKSKIELPAAKEDSRGQFALDREDRKARAKTTSPFVDKDDNAQNTPAAEVQKVEEPIYLPPIDGPLDPKKKCLEENYGNGLSGQRKQFRRNRCSNTTDAAMKVPVPMQQDEGTHCYNSAANDGERAQKANLWGKRSSFNFSDACTGSCDNDVSFRSSARVDGSSFRTGYRCADVTSNRRSSK